MLEKVGYGLVIGQSHAILRSLARIYDLQGENELQYAKCDELVILKHKHKYIIYKYFISKLKHF